VHDTGQWQLAVPDVISAVFRRVFVDRLDLVDLHTDDIARFALCDSDSAVDRIQQFSPRSALLFFTYRH